MLSNTYLLTIFCEKLQFLQLRANLDIRLTFSLEILRNQLFAMSYNWEFKK